MAKVQTHPAIDKKLKHYKVINVTDLINPAFYDLWLAEHNHIIAKGGRSSMKSSVISLKLVEMKMADPLSNFVCLRKVANTLYKSVYQQIKWALYEMGVANEFTFGKSPMEIVHKKTGTGFYFSGCDDPQKLKSMKIPVGYVSALWFEELAEFAGVQDIDVVEDTFIRQDLPDGKEVKVFMSYNPPRNPYEWVNEYVDTKRGDDDFLIHHTTYLDDEMGFLSKQIIKKIEKYKKNDYDYYRWMYLGEVIGLGDNVYNMNLFKAIKELPADDKLRCIDFAIDTGHQISATTCLALALTVKGNVILLDTFYYSPANKVVKLAPSELSELLNNFMKKVAALFKAPIEVRTIDSAEGGIRNQYYKDYNIRLHPVDKGTKVDMIDGVHDLLAQGRFYYLEIPSNNVFVVEHRKYQWDEDTINSAKPEVVKTDDHTCDAFQYYCKDNRKKLKLVS
ncbi:PBSX family phage terminase large subunit [Listeria booriae]|uniref:PBSX family phage terminase large subunit n=1 Tax=Listeria booriae TaxID=1552123 RepID=UPI00162419AB|nr:PBSX family phage terminase large subunit [Listeria booriae]MBC2318774.1 PBSX family phage terminase large subunit [Listeria booriae]